MPKAKTKRSSSRKSTSSSGKNEKVERILIENFIALQKVMTNLSVKFDDLTVQLSKLLELFEISAKTLAKKDMDSEKSSKNNEEMLKKLDSLLDQNKTIARGLTLMHEMNSSSENNTPNIPPRRPMMQQQSEETPRMPYSQSPPAQSQRQSIELNNYQKSISSRDDIPPKP